jgi:hypothetical protein
MSTAHKSRRGARDAGRLDHHTAMIARHTTSVNGESNRTSDFRKLKKMGISS